MKMMNNKTSLALTMATCLGIVSPQALAIVKLSDSSAAPAATQSAVGGPVLFAAEQTGESSLGLINFYLTPSNVVDGDLTVWLDKMPSNYTVTAIKTLFVRVALTGGAKFLAEPKLICANRDFSAQSTGVLSATTNEYSGAPSASIASATNWAAEIQLASSLIMSANISAINKATATFNILSGITTTDSGCLITFSHVTATLNASGDFGLTAYAIGARQDIGMTVDVGYIQAGSTITTTFSGTFIKFVTALQASITAQSQAATAALVTIDVKQASKKFAAGGTVDTLVGLLGSVTVTSAAARLSTMTAGNSTASLARIMSTGSVTITGPLLAGVASINAYSGLGCTTDEVANAVPTVSSGGSNSVTLTGITVTSLIGGIDICAKVDGTKTLNNGQITASLTGGGVTNFTPTFGDGNLVNVGINGSRVRVLNIPPVGNADQAFIRFYNTSTQGAVVRGTLYGQDGKFIGTENAELFNPLKANDVEILDAAKLAAKLGVTAPWTGRAWLLVQAELDPSVFKVQGLVRAPSNVLINLSTDAFN